MDYFTYRLLNKKELVKYFLLFFAITGYINNCLGQKYVIEKKLLKEVYKSSEKVHINLKTCFANYENLMLENKVLSGKKGACYQKLFEKMSRGDDSYYLFRNALPDSMDINQKLLKVISQKEVIKNLTEILKNQKIKKSKLYRLNSAVDSIVKLDNVNVTIVSVAILKTLSVRDFKTDFYKMYSLFIIYFVLDYDMGMLYYNSK